MDDFAESILHVLRLLDFIIRPLPVKPKHGNSMFVDDVRIDLAIAIVVCDHFAAAGEVDGGTPESAIVVFESFPVTTHAVVPFDAAHEPERWSPAASAAELDVIPAREIELPVIEPPGHVEMHTAHTVFIVWRSIGHLGNVSPDR